MRGLHSYSIFASTKTNKMKNIITLQQIKFDNIMERANRGEFITEAEENFIINI